MIQLRYDCLAFETAAGVVPCSAEEVAMELIGDAAAAIDPEVVRQAAFGVLHYFREELGREQVTVDEFVTVLVGVLRGFGLDAVPASPTPPAPASVSEADLARLATESERGFELVFYGRLRAEVEQRLRQDPRVLRFTGLQACVKELTGRRRWCQRCQDVSEQIVDYLRSCFAEACAGASCALVIT